MGRLKLVICCCLALYSLEVTGQYRWQLRDPLDFNFVDIGDNKLLLYNGIGVGLSALLSKNEEEEAGYSRHHLGVQYFKEYQRAPLSSLFALRYSWRWQMRKFLYVGAEARVYHATDTEVMTQGIGMSITYEWHIIRKPCFRLIYHNGVGPNLFAEQFPFGGTQFNFTTQYGLRSELLIGDQWYSLGIHNIHISNAEIRGRERNPSLDAIGVSIGVLLD